MGIYENYSKDPIFDSMIASVIERKDANQPFTARDLATEVSDSVKEFGKGYPRDGEIDRSYWSFRIGEMFKADPTKTLNELDSFLGWRGAPRCNAIHRDAFLEEVIHHPHADTVRAAMIADPRFATMDLCP